VGAKNFGASLWGAKNLKVSDQFSLHFRCFILAISGDSFFPKKTPTSIESMTNQIID
jgi:hypothetical protein